MGLSGQSKGGLSWSDLHAANARYHRDCRVNFMSPKSIAAALKSIQPHPEKVGESFQAVVKVLEEDLSRIWNSIDLHMLYTEHGGILLSRRIPITSNTLVRTL